MDDSLHIAEPVPLARPRGTHRFEAFSRKLARRVMFYRRSLLQQWLLLEADPKVISFCERPGYVLIDGHRRLADFLACYIDRKELAILIDQMADDSAKAFCRDLDSTAFPIRPVTPAELAATRVWTDNWQRMLPYLVANRRLVPPTLLRAITSFVKHPQRLLAIEREFSVGDPLLVRTTLFSLLHSGKISAPELRTQPLSLLTSFVAEATS